MNFRWLTKINISSLKNISGISIDAFSKPHKSLLSTTVKESFLADNVKQFSIKATKSAITWDATESDKDKELSNDILSKINTQIKEKSHGRLFAVIQFCEHQFKITDEDILAVGSFFPAKVGDKICLEKVLLLGSSDFTLLGRPLLSKELLRIEATVIEKTYIVPRPLYRHYKQYRRLHWFRTPYALFRINSIEFKNTLDELPDVEGLQNRVIY